jgi:MFS family permease
MHRGDSVSWLICTIFQALLTWGFIFLSKLSEGWAWEGHAKVLVLIAIVATWVMALRTIRTRILELLRFWRNARKSKAGEMDREREERLDAARTAYVKSSMFRLRVIAAGITMPFFILPAFVSALCVGACFWEGVMDGDFLGFSLFLSVLTAIVGAYFHWAVVPMPATAVVKRVAREEAPKVLQENRVE